MNEDIRRCTTIRLYLPDGADNAKLLQELLPLAGGATMWVGKGCWRAPDGTLLAEDVGVHEFILTGITQGSALTLVKGAGYEWMELNAKEQCFLAYVSGHQVKINRN